mmetsp:Transcript_21764/g.44693  ORF Transcript_21764/g.44693 Transcript_21764/m.44693 type:complete len:235 (+) Transcript_21764:559-1263(+)
MCPRAHVPHLGRHDHDDGGLCARHHLLRRGARVWSGGGHAQAARRTPGEPRATPTGKQQRPWALARVSQAESQGWPRVGAPAAAVRVFVSGGGRGGGAVNATAAGPPEASRRKKRQRRRKRTGSGRAQLLLHATVWGLLLCQFFWVGRGGGCYRRRLQHACQVGLGPPFAARAPALLHVGVFQRRGPLPGHPRRRLLAHPLCRKRLVGESGSSSGSRGAGVFRDCWPPSCRGPF